jgi:hypothetical protein
MTKLEELERRLELAEQRIEKLNEALLAVTFERPIGCDEAGRIIALPSYNPVVWPQR